MSDDGKKGGYKFDYAPNARAACKGPKPCKGTKLEKGALRLASVVDFRGHTSWAYRHYGCTTKKIFENMKAVHSSPEEVEGFDALNDDDKERVTKAWEAGEVAAEDVPASAQAGADEDDDAPKKKPGRPRKKQKTDDDDGDDEPKPKKKAGRPRKTKKKDSDDDADISPTDDDAGSDYGSGKKRKRGGPSKRGASKKKAADDDDDE